MSASNAAYPNALELVAGGDDPRPWWKRLDAEVGLPLSRAALFYGHPRDAETVATYHARLLESEFGVGPWGTDLPKASLWREILRPAEARLRASLKRKLGDGELFATGFSDKQPLDRPASRIVPERWRTLELDILESSASSPGLTVTGILVFDPNLLARQPGGVPSQFSEAAVRRWYQRRIVEKEGSGVIPSRDDDFDDARQAFGRPISRNFLRRLRRESAPEEWVRKGRRKRAPALPQSLTDQE